MNDQNLKFDLRNLKFENQAYVNVIPHLTTENQPSECENGVSISEPFCNRIKFSPLEQKFNYLIMKFDDKYCEA